MALLMCYCLCGALHVPDAVLLHYGHIGLIAALLLAVLSHRLRMRRFPPIG
jgi:hypothetical protein